MYFFYIFVFMVNCHLINSTEQFLEFGVISLKARKFYGTSYAEMLAHNI